MKVFKIPKAADLFRNADGTWTAKLYGVRFVGTYLQATNWLRRNA
jgi:hypothetical protein